jgi:hypothetical protein
MEKEKKYIYLTNKKSGEIYVYENHSYWSKEKKQPRSIRKCIGKLDKKTNEIVPTKGRTRRKTTDEKRNFYGLTYLFDSICEQIGLTEDLKNAFQMTIKRYCL